MFQHAVDSMEEFAHNSADCLQGLLAVIHEVLEIGFDVWVVLFGTQGWHVEG